MSSRKKSRKKKASNNQHTAIPPEPVAARVMQAAILTLAMLFLFSAIITPRIAPILVGLIILITAFPPIRGPVDAWFTGKRRGKVAQQAAALRMALGAAAVLTSIMSVFTRS